MKGKTPVFSVIIPVHNRWDLTEACLRSLQEHTREYAFEVVVIDNASGDATATELAGLGHALFGDAFTRIRFEENRNFGPASNVGAATATAPLLFFLNNDTLMTPGWAAPLLEALETGKRLAGVGPLLLYEDNKVQHLGVAFGARFVQHLYAGFPATHPVVGKRRKFQVITAAALMMPNQLFAEHNGFFEGFRNGFEDVDLCLRVSASGMRFSCIPESRIYHLESQTPGRNRADDANAALLAERWGTGSRTDLHIYAISDGFVPFVDDLFELGIRMPEEVENSLLERAEGRDIQGWQELLDQNPLWVTGRRRLAALLEGAGYFEQALFLRIGAASISGSKGDYKEMLRCAGLAGNKEARETAEERLMRVIAFKADKKNVEAVARALIKRAIQQHDKLLEGLYRDKLNAFSGGVSAGSTHEK